MAFLLVLSCLPACWGQQRRLTIAEAEQLLLSANHQLAASKSAVEEARANVRQSHAIDNPEISVQHNVNNPLSHRYFDCGRDGETDVQVSQRIYIGGQRMNGVRRELAMAEAASCDYAEARRQLLHDLRTSMISLWGIDEKSSLCGKAITTLREIYASCSEQAKKGNLPQADAERVGTMLFEEEKESQALETQRIGVERDLQLMLGLEGVKIIPDIAFSRDSALLAERLYTADRLSALPSVRGAEARSKAAVEQVRLERSARLPQLSLTGEWDKNGNIGHNFFAVGVSVTVPLLNRNRGAIRAAEERSRQADIARDYALRDAKAGLSAAVATIRSLDKLDLSDGHLSRLDTMMNGAATQFRRRNITILEFADCYGAYKSARNSVVDSREQLMKAFADLRTITDGAM